MLKFDPNQGRMSAFDRSIQIMIVNKMSKAMEIDKEDRKEIEKSLGIKKKIVLQYDEDRNKNTKFYDD